MSTSTKAKSSPASKLQAYLDELKLGFVRDNHETLAKQAATAQWDYVDYLAVLVEGEVLERRQRGIERRIRQARFPVIKTLEPFLWTWPDKINRPQVQQLFRLKFVEDKANVILLGSVGLGKTHLATALGYTACQKGYSVLFATALDVINTLAAAQSTGGLKQAFNRYIKPSVLILDELGYLPIDKTGADLLFQIISQRYERGSLVITSNRVFKKWPEIFNNDSTLTSALLDRLLHHAETVIIEGKSYRMKDQIET